MKKIGIITGSLRKESFTKKLAAALADYLDGCDCEFIGIDLPMYNEDLDAAPPASWTAFRGKIAAKDAYIFATPEYNRSMPAVIKNALDIASRPYGQNVWAGKRAMLVGVSPGAFGGFGSCQHLKNSMAFLDIRLMNQPEAYIGNIAASLDENGKPAEKLAGFLQKLAEEFKAYIA